jgi:hypothetical protein
MTRSEIFKAAWLNVKQNGVSLSVALKAAWAQSKLGTTFAVVDWATKRTAVLTQFVAVKNDKFITKAANKELRSLDLEDTFGMIGEDVIAKNKARFKAILATAITLDEAYSFISK